MNKEDFTTLEELIYGQYRKLVRVELSRAYLARGGKNFSPASTSKETVMIGGGNEVYVNTNSISTISSSSLLDFQEVDVVGFIIGPGGTFTHLNQRVFLNGQNKVALNTPLARVEVVSNISPVNLSGTLYVYEDTTIVLGIPVDFSKVHIRVRPQDNRSFKAAATTGDGEFLILSSLSFGVFDRDFISFRNRSAEFSVEIRPQGGSFSSFAKVPLSSRNGYKKLPLEQPVIIAPNSDFRVVAEVSSVGTEVSCFLHGYYALEM